MHHHSHPAVVRVLQSDRLPDPIGHATSVRDWLTPYWAALSTLLVRAVLRLPFPVPVRAGAARPGAHARTRTTVRQVSPLPEVKQINARQRERATASLIARPGAAKPAHRRWAEPGS
jgi:hypothetical protein